MNDATATMAALGQFNSTLVYHRSASAAELQNDLAVLAEFDKEAERQSKRWGGFIAISAVAAIAGVVGTIFSSANDLPPLIVFGVVAIVVGIASSIYCSIHYVRWSRRNIEDRRYLLLQDLVTHLSCDMASDSPLEVELNGNDYHRPEFLSTGAGQPMVASGATSYRLPWLSLAGQFLDGHRFRVTATQLVKRKERRKRKYTKVKEAVCERVDVEVRCKPQKFARWEMLPAMLKQQKLDIPLQDWTLQVTGERVTLSGVMPRAVKVTGRGTTGSLDEGQLSSPAVLGLFVLLYRALAEVRK